MIADAILRILGETPGSYSELNKWPVITAIMVDTAVPVVITVVFFVPFAFLVWRKKKKGKDFTILNILLSLAIGGVLAYGLWWLNEWSYGYGLGIIYKDIYDI
jgi:hypothetical protein